MLKMTHLGIHLLGSFRVTLDGEPVTAFESDKVRALLAYLAVEAGRPHRREKLVGLLWPDWPEPSARKNLSQALYNLRAAIGDRQADPPFLLVTPQTLQFNPDSEYSLDLAHLAALRDGAPIEQVEEEAAHHDPFLADFSLPDSASFEEWATTTREALHRKALEALGRLAEHYQAAGDLEKAIGYARRAVALDPCSETTQRQLIHLLALSGDRGAALAQYESCRQVLWWELGVDPSAETQALLQRVQTEELAPAPSRPAPRPERRHS
jgi:DNA-binding SARP family transcriptional activator